ncbi:MAG: hypothetical protein EO766_17655 [Hydrotalea sp. AMD]|uniref:hypothetical protein n=1 Tax=Hydrotalea sp. AMD TaxID=2501297 RepID=UPI00102839B8|nr:hypothetical protein [Hydrotalea sp. AMD]RWZ83495.1 MAG: hypothetical protein EO766_17655 [Hydrotalea sp. AMD]
MSTKTNTTNAKTNAAVVLGAVNSQITQNVAVAAAVAVQVESKAAKGRAIWDRELAKVGGDGTKLVRKDIINLLKSEAGLTQAGAATYYQKMKEKAGLVNHRDVAAVAPATTTAEPAAE